MGVVVIWAERWDAMRDFYSQLLSAQPIADSDGFMHLGGPDDEVLLHRVPSEYVGTLDEPAAIRAEAALKPVFTVVAIDHFREVALKGEFAYQNWKYIDVADPDGNVISVRSAL